MRFNAPPPADVLHFHDQSSYYDGSVISNSYHNNMVPQGNSPMVANRGGMMYRGQQPYNQMDPPIPRVIVSPQVIHSPMTTPRNAYVRPNGVAPPYRNNGHPMPNNDMAAMTKKEDEYRRDGDNYINANCMNTFFGSSVKSKRRNGRKSRVLGCDALNISTSGDVEIDFGMQTNCTRPHRLTSHNAFQCSGIRGVGKKFNYSYDESNSDESESTSESIEETKYDDREQDLACSKPVAECRDDVHVRTNRVVRHDSTYGDLVVPSNSSSGKNSPAYSTSHCKKKIESPSSDDTGASVHASFDQHSYIADAITNVKAQIERNIKMWEEARDGKVSNKLNEEMKTFEKSCTVSTPANDVYYGANQTRPITETRNNDRLKRVEDSPPKRISVPIINDYVSEAYPSFDEPAELPPCVIVTDQSSNNASSFSSGEENRQRDANTSRYKKNDFPLTKTHPKTASTVNKHHTPRNSYAETTFLVDR